MKVLSAHIREDYTEWLTLWENWRSKDVFAHPDYLLLYKDPYWVRCAVLRKNGLVIMFPFLLRSVSNGQTRSHYYDIISPYGYGDVYQVGEGDFKAIKKEFYPQFKNWAKENNIVSEFLRFNLFSESLNDYHGHVVHNNDNVVCDLTKGIDLIWEEFKPKVRQNIRKALRNGLKVTVDDSWDRMQSFINLYYRTMSRLNAKEKYFFDRDFFYRIMNRLKGCFTCFYVNYSGVDIASELVLISNEAIYYFLGGSHEKYFEKRPNELLNYEIMKWGIREGKKFFVLGGGYRPGDSLFAFKKAFAPDGVWPFHVGKKIYNDLVYNSLVEHSEQEFKKAGVDLDLFSDFFPLYRAGEADFVV